ncbi:MAG: CBS domain-containing protein [Proteobacteria bacterium]|jgi:signal-transduction protein with cAMP-binding, CBS, and nucleotidyltransferase domain|nr:CBS domain-containing protein [Pseudomonadota bacterium]
MKIEQLLAKKGNDVCSINPEASVYEAIQKMAEKNVGALLVMHEDKVAGIISERDYTRKLILKNRSSKDTPVADVMTKDVCYVTQQEQVNECMALMTEKRIRHLPVIEDGKVLGVISLGDVVKTIIDEQDHEIQDYEQYIRGWY